jgi:hypothetical protein
MKCKCCERDFDTRFGFCFDCAESESVIHKGKDMYDDDIEKREGMSMSMSKLRYILEKYGIVKNTNRHT